MRVLLDTHAFLWAIGDPARLSSRAKKIITGSSNELILSCLSIWEIILKEQQGKLKLPVSLGYLEAHIQDLGIRTVLAVQASHIYGVLELPMYHKDPFDRLLISQCRVEDLAFLSADPEVRKYPLTVIW